VDNDLADFIDQLVHPHFLQIFDLKEIIDQLEALLKSLDKQDIFVKMMD